MNWIRAKYRTIFLLWSFIVAGSFWGLCSFKAVAKSRGEVAKRLAKIQREYPEDSRFDGKVTVGRWTGGGCNALVMYATLKVFHNAYTPSAGTYQLIGCAKTSKKSKLKKLFRKAKIGDVVRFRSGKEDTHFAVFVSYGIEGIRLYESNFGLPNRVKNKNLWRWHDMKSWPVGGATHVEVYRSKNYTEVDRKQAAKNYPVGTVLLVDGFRILIIKNTYFGGEALLLSDADSLSIGRPRYVFVDNKMELGGMCNYSGCIVYGKKKNLNYELTYRITGCMETMQ